MITNLDQKAQEMEAGLVQNSIHNGMVYGHRKDISGDWDSLVSISDALHHTGKGLVSQCLRLEYARKINDPFSESGAITIIQDIVFNLYKHQLALNDDGQLGRFFIEPGIRMTGIPTWTKREEGYYTWRQMTFDQYISIFYGLYYVNKVKKYLNIETVERLNIIVDKLGTHFLKYNGFIGEETNLRASPWYVAWSIKGLFGRGGHQAYRNDWLDKLINIWDKYVVKFLNYIIFRAFNPFKKHILYKSCILYVCKEITHKEQYKKEFDKHYDKYKDILREMENQQTLIDKWYVRFFMKFMYKVRNHKWKFWKYFRNIPDDIIIDPEHLESTIGPDLRFMALIPLAEEYNGYLKILKEEMKKVYCRRHPWYIAQYYNLAINNENITECKYHDISYHHEMKAYRGPKMYNNGPQPEVKYDNYLMYIGNIKFESNEALSAEYYLQHWSWPQSKVFESGSWFGPESNFYDDYVSWLIPYYIGKLNGWI